MIKTTVNDRITQLIEHENLTTNSFANRLGVKPTVIYNIQKGRNKPSFDLLTKIIDVFQANSSWLLMGFGEIKPSVISNDKTTSPNEAPRAADFYMNVSILTEPEFINQARGYVDRINDLFQRLIDIRVLLFQELGIKGELSTTIEVELLNSLAKPSLNSENELIYPYKNLDGEGKKKYLKEAESCIQFFTNTFFECFEQLYNGLKVNTRRK
jgi:transcriptional regulator with XRE-family HTH domain